MLICPECGAPWGNYTTHSCGGRSSVTIIGPVHNKPTSLKRAIVEFLAWVDDRLHCNIRPLCHFVCDLQSRGWDD